MTTKSTGKLKLIPGRGLTGIDIKKRLRNRTLEGQIFGSDAYAMNEEMNKFMKMSKTEQIAKVRSNNIEIKKLQNKLEQETNEQKRKLQEQDIENKIQERIKEIVKQQSQQKPTI